MAAFTDRELDIMTVLWQQGTATPAEVRDALAADGVDLAYTTVQTMLRIMQDKGFVGYVVEGRAHRFHPLVRRDDASRSALRRLLDGLFDRSPELLLTHLVRDEQLDRATLERLRAVVEHELAAPVPPPKPVAKRAARRRET